MRPTLVSRMAASHASDATIMALAGYLSRKMMEHTTRMCARMIRVRRWFRW
jgi:hypothetical protein